MAYKLYTKALGVGAKYPAGVSITKGGAKFSKAAIDTLKLNPGTKFDLFVDEEAGRVGFNFKPKHGNATMVKGHGEMALLTHACRDAGFEVGFYPIVRTITAGDDCEATCEIRRPSK